MDQDADLFGSVPHGRGDGLVRGAALIPSMTSLDKHRETYYDIIEKLSRKKHTKNFIYQGCSFSVGLRVSLAVQNLSGCRSRRRAGAPWQ